MDFAEKYGGIIKNIFENTKSSGQELYHTLLICRTSLLSSSLPLQMELF